MMFLSYKYRIYPNESQEAGIHALLQANCQLYNAALEQRIDAYRKGTSLSYFTQTKEVKNLKLLPEYKDYPSDMLGQTLRRLDKAFKSFFARNKKGLSKGFPRFKPYYRFNTIDLTYGNGSKIKKDKLYIKGVDDLIQVKWHRDIPDDAIIKQTKLNRKNGNFYVIFALELPDVNPIEPRKAVGIDLGLTTRIATSDGKLITVENQTKKAKAKTRKLSRSLARKKLGGKNRAKARLILSKHHEKIVN
ncbi:MAG: transposase, partial [Endozoicomonadaceae bacterium]|nr:transposase [Endozoicomonadaceae bacterium]